VAPLDPLLFDHLASDPCGTIFTVPSIADHPTNPFFAALQQALDDIDARDVAVMVASPEFKGMHGDLDSAAQDREARINIFTQQVGKQIWNARLTAVTSNEAARPAPYDHPSLSDLELSEDLLVPLRSFELDGSVLIRHGHAFTPLPPVESPNAMYWFMSAVTRLGLQASMALRLDPLMHAPASEFPRIGFKMWMYGRHLDLSTLTTITDESFGRWLPGRGSAHASEYTDYVWSPRDDELHLTVEELPIRERIATRGSRYFHAIYRPKSGRFIHADGAIRVFTEEQWAARCGTHVRNAGKAGLRVKVFRLDEAITTEALTTLCAPYFVWNYDIAKFCGMDVPDAFLGSAA